MTSQPYYISRKPAEDFVTAFGKALEEPASHPLLFHVHGIGGIGKSTLLEKLQQTHQQASVAKFDFSGKAGIRETPLKVMATLYEQLPKPDLWKRELFKSDPFHKLYQQYNQTLARLENEPIEGKQVVEEDQRNLVKELGSAAVYGLGALLLAPIEPVSALGLGANALAETTKGTVTGVSAIKERVLLKHPATKRDKQLQELLLEPIPQLTKAFVEGLLQIQNARLIQLQKVQNPPIILVLDHYEKATSDLNLWLSEYLLKEKDLQPQPIRIVAAGRYSLKKKSQKIRNLIYERELERFDKKQTEAYLKKIGITEPREIQQIYQATGGFPFHLDLIRQQHEEGRKINCSRDNRELVDRLLEDLTPAQKQVIQLAAYCRWFDESLIQELMAANRLNFKTDADASLNCFEWLSQQELVIEDDHFRLKDVARDVLRRWQCKKNQKKFRETHALIAKYFERLANEEVHPDNLPPVQYESSKWREYTAESIYHALFANRDYGQHQLMTHFFAGAYLNQIEVVIAPFAAVAAEAEIEDYELLPDDTRKFLDNINLAIGLGWQVLEINPDNYEFKLGQIGDIKPQIEASLKPCLGKVDSLDGLAKYAGLMYQFLRCRPSKRLDLLLRAKEQAEQIVTPTHPEFSSSLFFNVSNGFYQLGHYEEVIASYDKALAIKDDFPEAWHNRGAALANLGRYEEAIASYDKALEIKPDNPGAWYNRGAVLANLGRYEEAIASYDKALEIKPDDPEAWNNRGNVLVDLGRYEEAIASYDKALEIKPDDPEAWNNRGNALVDLGRYEEAITSYDKALEIKPNDFNTLVNRSAALLNLSRYEEMIASCDKVLRIQPDNPDALSNQGLALSLLGRYNDALANHDKALKLQPNDSLLWANRGIVLARWGRYEKALASCDKALELQPNDESGYYGKACCYALQGDSYMAIENLQQAINLNPHRCRSEAKTNPDFDNIRTDSRFQALMQECTN
ncbi:tetratricopeptide repeat protein [Trichocoleus sp. Lan]|uniref:tetratricopeptide repeat protein n=1 Tax=Trichocoleus sp. Lan TaxID=2933927 RepID=UPI003297ED08